MGSLKKNCTYCDAGPTTFAILYKNFTGLGLFCSLQGYVEMLERQTSLAQEGPPVLYVPTEVFSALRRER